MTFSVRLYSHRHSPVAASRDLWIPQEILWKDRVEAAPAPAPGALGGSDPGLVRRRRLRSDRGRHVGVRHDRCSAASAAVGRGPDGAASRPDDTRGGCRSTDNSRYLSRLAGRARRRDPPRRPARPAPAIHDAARARKVRRQLGHLRPRSSRGAPAVPRRRRCAGRHSRRGPLAPWSRPRPPAVGRPGGRARPIPTRDRP